MGVDVVMMNLVRSRPSRRPGSFTALGGISVVLLLVATVSVQAGASDANLVKDIKPGSQSSEPASLVRFGDRLYFAADDGTYGEELWTSDGTTSGTYLVKDINLGAGRAFPAELTIAGGLLFFRADDGALGRELWKSDGTGAGTSLVKDINPGAGASSPVELAALDGALLFQADDGSRGRELWKSDGTRAGTVLVKDILSGSGSSDPALLTELDGSVFFRASDGSHGSELWKSDGTAAGTAIIRDICVGLTGSDPTELVVVGGTLFLSANDGTNGAELWKSDGTAAGTVMVKDIRPSSASSFPRGLTAMDGRVYFAASDDSGGVELWRSDGTASGTVRVKDIRPGTGSATPDSLLAIGRTLFFSADDGIHGAELWRSDGTSGGTVLLQDVNPGTAASFPYYLTEGRGALFFGAHDGSHGIELWRSDGRTTGTGLAADISPGSSSSSPWYLTTVGGQLFFRAEDGTRGRELWAMQLPAPDLVMAKAVTPAGTVAPNALITYTLTYQNNGDAWALGASIVDPLPVELANISVESTSPVTLTAGAPYTWQVGDLAPGAGGIITVKGTVVPQQQSGYLFTNTVSITATSVEIDMANNEAAVGVEVNFPPVAAPDSYSTVEDNALTVPAKGVLANDYDAEGSPLTAALEKPPAVGDLALSPDGSFLYTPPENWFGVTTFTYYASDGIARSGKATVTLKVTAVNDPPVVAGDSYSTSEDTLLSVPLPGVLGNDQDAENDPLTAVLDSPPASGTLALKTNGSFVYTPAPNFHGVVSFSYHAWDGLLESNTVTVTIHVVPVNDAPVAADDSYNTTEDKALVVAPPGVLVSDSDVDGDPLEAILNSLPGTGTLLFRQDGSFTYTPAANFHGVVIFSYYARDGRMNSNIATVTISVAPVNDAPVAADDSYALIEDTHLVVPAPGLLANDMDLDGESLTAVLDTPPQKGLLSLNPDGSFTYQPEANYAGVLTFAYRASDGAANSNRATVTLTVAGVNDPPRAESDWYDVIEDTPLNLAAPGVLLNDQDVEGDPLTARLLEPATSGTLTLRPNGSLDFAPAPDFFGDVLFTYRANDGHFDSDPATVTLRVAGVNDAPVAVDDSYRTLDDDTLRVDAPGVLGNDSDVEGDWLTAVLETLPPAGTLVFDAAGSFTYSPTPNLPGVFAFTYHTEDGALQSKSATVIITVKDKNIPPVASPDNYSTVEDVPLRIAAPGVLGNDEDEWGDTLSAILETGPSEGELLLGSDGALVYTPTLNFNGSVSFTYRATDGIDASSPAAVTLSVTAVNDPPVGVNDWYMTGKGRTLVILAPGVLANDSDVEGNQITAILHTGPASGGLGLAPDGSFVYIPAAAFAGAVAFQYRAYDGSGYSLPVQVEIEVAEHVVHLPIILRQYR